MVLPTAVSEDISMLESRMRQELIAVQVRCDRLAREVQRIGALSVLALAQLCSSHDCPYQKSLLPIAVYLLRPPTGGEDHSAIDVSGSSLLFSTPAK